MYVFEKIKKFKKYTFNGPDFQGNSANIMVFTIKKSVIKNLNS